LGRFGEEVGFDAVEEAVQSALEAARQAEELTAIPDGAAWRSSTR